MSADRPGGPDRRGATERHAPHDRRRDGGPGRDGQQGGSERRAVPTGTYRLQLHMEFSFTDAAVIIPYLAALGVSHLYLSPILEAAPGSTHGYDVVDHSQISPELGGLGGLRRLVAAARRAGLGLIADVVPNHMAVLTPGTTNTAWWSVLREGPDSPYASWFDIDWDSPDNPGRVLLPLLGQSLADSLAADEITVEQDEDGEWVIVYYDHVLPVAAGTANPADVAATLDAQYYRLCWWRVGG
ncbi:alpha-amylase family glycosyl hydrolase, partial [Frankia sp. EI5c]|uniref:alpha-amylase family glycosyl hydrolase n=1 Tax=Frankia sp. EI5c TaxID=683316 RepID=UPI0021017D80